MLRPPARRHGEYQWIRSSSFIRCAVRTSDSRCRAPRWYEMASSNLGLELRERGSLGCPALHASARLFWKQLPFEVALVSEASLLRSAAFMSSESATRSTRPSRTEPSSTLRRPR